MLATATPPEISWRELPLADGLGEAAESYPETRIGAFDFSEATGTEVLGYASGSPHRASIDSCCELAADLGLYTQPDPIGLRGGPNLFQYANGNPVNATDPRGLRTCVIFARDSLAGVDVSHTALVVFGPCANSGGGCSQPTRFLYDPAGGYRQRERGSGGLFEGSEFTMAGYFAFHAASGTPVEMFCFDTTCCEEQELRKRAESIGDPRGFSCSASVSACLAGVGRFGGIRETGRPGVCRQQIQNLQLQESGR